MKLSDNSIAQMVRALQVALLTGTDVTDNFRQMRFVLEDDVLEPDPEYTSTFEEGISRLAASADGLKSSDAN